MSPDGFTPARVRDVRKPVPSLRPGEVIVSSDLDETVMKILSVQQPRGVPAAEAGEAVLLHGVTADGQLVRMLAAADVSVAVLGADSCVDMTPRRGMDGGWQLRAALRAGIAANYLMNAVAWLLVFAAVGYVATELVSLALNHVVQTLNPIYSPSDSTVVSALRRGLVLEAVLPDGTDPLVSTAAQFCGGLYATHVCARGRAALRDDLVLAAYTPEQLAIPDSFNEAVPAGGLGHGNLCSASIGAARSGEPSPVGDSSTTAPAWSVYDAQRALADLLEAWGRYRLDTEAWYLTKPLLHDITGTVATTVAYQNAMDALSAAVDALSLDAEQETIDNAMALADQAWSAWHEANDYAGRVGLDDRTPTERAALERLNKLVRRLMSASASDPELPLVKQHIQECLDRVRTVSVSWSDIAELPAVGAKALRALPQSPS